MKIVIKAGTTSGHNYLAGEGNFKNKQKKDKIEEIVDLKNTFVGSIDDYYKNLPKKNHLNRPNVVRKSLTTSFTIEESKNKELCIKAHKDFIKAALYPIPKDIRDYLVYETYLHQNRKTGRIDIQTNICLYIIGYDKKIRLFDKYRRKAKGVKNSINELKRLHLAGNAIALKYGLEIPSDKIKGVKLDSFEYLRKEMINNTDYISKPISEMTYREFKAFYIKKVESWKDKIKTKEDLVKLTKELSPDYIKDVQWKNGRFYLKFKGSNIDHFKGIRPKGLIFNEETFEKGLETLRNGYIKESDRWNLDEMRKEFLKLSNDFRLFFEADHKNALKKWRKKSTLLTELERKEKRYERRNDKVTKEDVRIGEKIDRIEQLIRKITQRKPRIDWREHLFIRNTVRNALHVWNGFTGHDEIIAKAKDNIGRLRRKEEYIAHAYKLINYRYWEIEKMPVEKQEEIKKMQNSITDEFIKGKFNAFNFKDTGYEKVFETFDKKGQIIDYGDKIIVVGEIHPRIMARAYTSLIKMKSLSDDRWKDSKMVIDMNSGESEYHLKQLYYQAKFQKVKYKIKVGNIWKNPIRYLSNKFKKLAWDKDYRKWKKYEINSLNRYENMLKQKIKEHRKYAEVLKDDKTYENLEKVVNEKVKKILEYIKKDHALNCLDKIWKITNKAELTADIIYSKIHNMDFYEKYTISKNKIVDIMRNPYQTLDLAKEVIKYENEIISHLARGRASKNVVKTEIDFKRIESGMGQRKESLKREVFDIDQKIRRIEQKIEERDIESKKREQETKSLFERAELSYDRIEETKRELENTERHIRKNNNTIQHATRTIQQANKILEKLKKQQNKFKDSF